LFTEVRDSQGLTYDVSFELNLFDRLNLGWYVISVTSTPGKVHRAVNACKGVLIGLHSKRIAEHELDRAKRTMLMKHEAETKSNALMASECCKWKVDLIDVNEKDMAEKRPRTLKGGSRNRTAGGHADLGRGH
ncbi:stromal processing peptidase chloroplastic, partial [Tanacetum coccineum]